MMGRQGHFEVPGRRRALFVYLSLPSVIMSPEKHSQERRGKASYLGGLTDVLDRGTGRGQGEALPALPSSPRPKLLSCLVSVAFSWAGSPPGENRNPRRPGVGTGEVAWRTFGGVLGL